MNIVPLSYILFEKEFNQLAFKYNSLLDNNALLQKQYDENKNALEDMQNKYTLLQTQYNERKEQNQDDKREDIIGIEPFQIKLKQYNERKIQIKLKQDKLNLNQEQKNDSSFHTTILLSTDKNSPSLTFATQSDTPFPLNWGEKRKDVKKKIKLALWKSKNQQNTMYTFYIKKRSFNMLHKMLFL